MRAVMAAVIAVIAASGGCGGNGMPTNDERLTKDEYLGELAVVTGELETVVGACVDSNFTSSDCEEIARSFDDASESVEGLRPPLDVDDIQVRLVLGLRETADNFRRLDRITTESEGLDPLDALVKLGDAQESRTLDAAAREFEKRGYRVPAFLSGS